MKSKQLSILSIAVAGALSGVQQQAVAGNFLEALTGGTPYADFRLRYEESDQDNTKEDAEALTLRSRLGYKTGSFSGFSALIEIEDVMDLGVDDFNNTVDPKRAKYSVIADPNTTEIDQGFIQYKAHGLTAKLGRQVITYDNHRFVGHVGWRQDRQTFDGFTLNYVPVEGASLSYGYIDQRNRIFGEHKDQDSKDHLFNASYITPIGKLTGYAYLLDEDEGVTNEIDTYGVRLSGSQTANGIKLLYTAEYADQEMDTGAASFDMGYYLVEGGVNFNGVTFKVGHEVLESDNGAKGFATPLATAHAFNGWSDQFLGTPTQGLEDTYVMVGTKIAGGSLKAIYHEFEANDSTATIDDLGDELNIVYSRKFGKNYSGGIKYASYSAGDVAAGKVDNDKLWVWVGATF